MVQNITVEDEFRRLERSRQEGAARLALLSPAGAPKTLHVERRGRWMLSRTSKGAGLATARPTPDQVDGRFSGGGFSGE